MAELTAKPTGRPTETQKSSHEFHKRLRGESRSLLWSANFTFLCVSSLPVGKHTLMHTFSIEQERGQTQRCSMFDACGSWHTCTRAHAYATAHVSVQVEVLLSVQVEVELSVQVEVELSVQVEVLLCGCVFCEGCLRVGLKATLFNNFYLKITALTCNLENSACLLPLCNFGREGATPLTRIT